MASRGAFGFRSAKPPEKEDKKNKAQRCLARTASITSTAPSTSKLPTQSSSFFSRNKQAKPKTETQTRTAPSANIPGSRGQNIVDVSSTRSDMSRSSEARLAQSVGGGSSAGTTTVSIKSGKPRNVLRRRAPSIEPSVGYPATESSASSYEPSRQYLTSKSSPGGYHDSEPRSIMGLSAPQASHTTASYQPRGLGLGSEYATSSSHMATYNSRRNPQSTSTSTLPPPTPTQGHDSGSSTRRSESPGAFSRTSTPTSMSSQSPGVPIPLKAPLRPKTTSPTRSRPPVSTRGMDRIAREEKAAPRTTGLASVRESATSSSSSSTIKPESRTGGSRTPHADLPSPNPITPPPTNPPGSGPSSQGQGFPLRKGSLKYREEQVSKTASRPAGSAPRDQDHTGAASSQAGRARMPPTRPSRDGVEIDERLVSLSQQHPALQPSAPIIEGESRVIHDNERYRGDGRSGGTQGVRVGLSRTPSAASSAFTSRMPSPNVASSVSKFTSPTESSRSRPSVETSISAARSSKDPSPQSAGSSKSSSRFGFFTRRTRSPMETTASEQADKAAKKGPAAGTGHEGYGKYARRGRSGSTTSASRGRSTSSTSIGRTPSSRKSSLTSRDGPELDDFYRDRLAPKPITGGGREYEAASDPYATWSAQSSVSAFDYPTSSGNRARVPASDSQTSLQEPAQRLHHINRRLPQRDDDPAKASVGQSYQPSGAPSLATRRSLHRSQTFQDAEPIRIPAPINTEATAPSPMTSRDTFQSQLRTQDSTVPVADDISEGHEGNWLKSNRTPKTKKSPRKWNFFQRTQASPKPALPTAPRSDDDQGNAKAALSKASVAQEARQVPFYALMDNSEQGSTDLGSMSQLARSTSQVNRSGSFSVPRSRDTSPDKQSRKVSMLLPSPPTMMTAFPKSPGRSLPSQSPAPPAPVLAQPASVEEQPSDAVTSSEPRKPRLQQIGRIPRVVSKRDRLHHPPPQSFSRPRPYTPRQEDVPRSAPVVASGGQPPGPESSALDIQTESILQRPWDAQDFARPARTPVQTGLTSNPSSRRDEFMAFPPRIGSEVSGSSSSGILSYVPADTTAVVPEPGAAPSEDEIWNEYYEYLDTVESPGPATGGEGSYLEKGKGKARLHPPPLHIRKDSSVTGSKTSSPERFHAATYPPAAAAPNRDLPSPPKKSKFLEVPPTPGTISDLLAGYADRDSTVSKHRSRSTTSRYSTSSIESEADSLAGHEASRSQPPSAAPQLTPAQRLSQIYLRRDALLASTWLSFDRVLFSPAHGQVQSNSKDRILVLDGLGNDEWSFYCAEHYPTATIYNLSPKARNDAPAIQIPGVPKPPDNHKHIQYTSLGSTFPFPQEFFAAAVFRFPAATSDAAYYSTISEFKRVLRPGGYLEMSMLDIDMINMGSLTRRALRALKERKQMASREVSLKPLSDNIQKMLGKKAFDNIYRVQPIVPVAGHVNSSRAESFDSASGKQLPVKPRSERVSGDIAKNLAKVGRWWFSSCYEAGVRGSIWNDKALLAECEARETGFRFLLCYAQKPVHKRRTRSF